MLESKLKENEEGLTKDIESLNYQKENLIKENKNLQIKIKLYRKFLKINKNINLQRFLSGKINLVQHEEQMENVYNFF